jgi:peptidoglycan/LPS O-acetylase OafA/YrhL
MAIGSSLALAAIFHWWIQCLPFPMLHTGMMTPLFAILVLGLSGNNVYARALSWRPFLVIGEASYCIYLLHFNTWILLHTYNVPARLGLARFEPWFSYAVILVFSVAAYYALELPARKWILSRFSHKVRPA